jgi:hypothetical protein
MRIAWDDALAVLAALVEPKDHSLRESAHLSLGAHRGDQLGLNLTYGVVHDTLLALHDLGYVEWGRVSYSTGPGVSIDGIRVTGRGMQALGQWPALHSAMTPVSLSHLLDALAPYAADGDKAGTLHEAADEARRMAAATLRQIIVSGGAAVVRRKLGLPT